MRKIEFNELKLKDKYDENTFLEFYLANLEKELQDENTFNEPRKKYEILYLNIFEGKIILLNKDYIKNDNLDNQELYYDYKTAYKIYNNLLDIYDGIECEKNECNELYIEERLKKDLEIEKLKKIDEELFSKAEQEYKIIRKNKLYEKSIKIKEENQKSFIEVPSLKNDNISFIRKIINKIKKICKIGNGENK